MGVPIMFVAYYGGDVYLKDATWEETYCILPHQCIATGEILMSFTKAMKGTRILEARGYHRYREVHWMTSAEFTYNKLKGLL